MGGVLAGARCLGAIALDTISHERLPPSAREPPGIPPALTTKRKNGSFHLNGREHSKALAAALGLEASTYDVRSNLGGIAVSGEVTMHGQNLYVQICQPATGADSRMLIAPARAARIHRRRNNFLPLSWLDQTEALAGYCRRILDREGGRS